MKSLLKMTLISTAILFSLTACDNQSTDNANGQNASNVAPISQIQQKEINSLDDIVINESTESYAVGASFGEYLKNHIESNKIDLNSDYILQGFNDAFVGKTFYNQEQVGYILQKLDSKIQEDQAKQLEADKTENIAVGKKFRDEFAQQPGVKQTESGLLYQIINDGSKVHATKDDVVAVNYTGTLVDGTVFDSSIDPDKPAQFPLANVIPGWQEGITLVGEGGKIKLVIPPELAYGVQGIPSFIPPESTLIFEVDLLKVSPTEETPAQN